jgi:hypothetical protein
MKKSYALYTLIVLIIMSPLSAKTQEMQKNTMMNWINKVQKSVQFKNQTSGISVVSVKPQLTRDLRQVWIGGEWFDSEDTRYHYNGTSKASDDVFYFNGSAWNLEEKTSYELNGTGLPAVITYEKYNGGQYTSKERYKLTYGYHFSTGEIILNQSEKEVWMNNAWVKDEMDTYSYLMEIDGAFLSGAITSYWDDMKDEWIEYEKFEMEQAGDNVIQTYSYKIDTWAPTGRTIYHSTTIREIADILAAISEQLEVYSSMPLMIVPLPETTLQYMKEGSWLDREMTSKIPMYDWMSGRLLQWKTEIIEWDENEKEWLASMVYLINYDEEMRPVSAAFEINEDGEVLRFSEDLFEYNEWGLMSEGVFRVDYGEGLKNMSRHTFTWAGTGTSIGDGPEFPVSYNLGNAYPNPFNPVTLIPYETGVAGHVTIRVYDILGRMVTTLSNGTQPAGKHQVRFDAAGLGSGKYLIRMDAPGYSQTRSVTLVK